MSSVQNKPKRRPRGRGQVTKARYANAATKAAERAFGALLAFYRNDTDAGLALGVGRDTVAEWRSSFPARPRAENTRRIQMLLALCLEVEPYMADKKDVGTWTLAPQPFLAGETPASAIRASGRDLFVRLATQLVDVVPRRRFERPAIYSDEQFRQALATGLGSAGMTALEDMRVAPRKVTSADLAEID